MDRGSGTQPRTLHAEAADEQNAEFIAFLANAIGHDSPKI